MQTLAGRIAALDRDGIAHALDTRGYALVGPVLTPAEAGEIAASYDDAARFRSRVVMQRHGFGRGEYRYFAYPLPDGLAATRAALYRLLQPVAQRWAAHRDDGAVYPATHDEYLAQCRAQGQVRPTPLLLRYGAGDYNCLHRDLYGAMSFPLQAAFLLSAPGADFDGGELVLTEQRPRAQSAVHVLPLRQGEGVIFAVDRRPVTGASGRIHHVTMRHGVSEIRRGSRHTLGVILHDAT